jgi:hypothetical protein
MTHHRATMIKIKDKNHSNLKRLIREMQRAVLKGQKKRERHGLLIFMCLPYPQATANNNSNFLFPFIIINK